MQKCWEIHNISRIPQETFSCMNSNQSKGLKKKFSCLRYLYYTPPEDSVNPTEHIHNFIDALIKHNLI